MELQPDTLLSLLDVQEGMAVADIGAGPGFFTLRLAQGTKGPVYAIDAEEAMLAILRKRAAERGLLERIRTLTADATALPLPDGAVERAVASFVLHEVGNLGQAIAELHRVLAPGGKLLVVDWEKKPSPKGPPLHHRLGSQELQEALSQKGFLPQASPHGDYYYKMLVTRP